MRVLDWQTASLGDPLDDLVRFELEVRPGRRLTDLQTSGARLEGTPPTLDHLADAVVMSYAGLVSGLAGRPATRQTPHERAVFERLLGPHHLLDAVGEAIERLG